MQNSKPVTGLQQTINKPPNMGMSVIRQQSQQSTSSGYHLPPTSAKSEKKIFNHRSTTRLPPHSKRIRRNKTNEVEAGETTPSLSSSSSTGKVNDAIQNVYETDNLYDSQSVINNQGAP